jgi:hypothetical protein
VVLSIEERVFLVEYAFREGNRYTDIAQERFAEKFPETPVPHPNAVRTVIEKFCQTSSVLGAKRSGRPSRLYDEKLIYRKCLQIKLNGFRPVWMLVGITSNTLHKCTSTFRTHFNKYILNYITNAPTCFGASAPSAGSCDIAFAKVTKYYNY